MKVLITTDLYTVTTNGVVTSVKNLCDELTADGHEVRILTLSEGMHSYKEGNVYYIRSVSLDAVYPDVRMPTSYRHPLIKELIEWHPDVIHSQCEFFTFQFALRIAKRTRSPIVHTYHTLYEQYATYLIPSKRLGKRAVRILSKKRLQRVSRVIAPTRKVENALRGYGLEGPISVVPSGISLEQHKAILSGPERLERRRSLGIGDDKTVLLNLGRLGTEKNIHELLRFFAEARKTRDDLMFLIVGDGPARTSLEVLAKELCIESSVIFTGMVDPRQVQTFYQLGDIFVSASTSETQGLTYIEACANGLPLLCREDPCLLDVLVPGENGFAYTCREDFLWALEDMVNDSGWRARAGQRSRLIASAFDKTVFGDNVEDIYHQVVREKAACEEPV